MNDFGATAEYLNSFNKLAMGLLVSHFCYFALGNQAGLKNGSCISYTFYRLAGCTQPKETDGS